MYIISFRKTDIEIKCNGTDKEAPVREKVRWGGRGLLEEIAAKGGRGWDRREKKARDR